MVKVLAVESSCDETSAAVVTDEDPYILSSEINSQIEVHEKYGGVVPEVAARNHLENIDIVIEKALKSAGNLDIKNDIDVVAATAGPGLVGSLLVGLVTAKTIAMLSGKPFMAINHLEGHLLTARLSDKSLDFPYLLLLASGGHFIYANVKGVGNYEILGETLDDAAGEAFDKVARMLGLPYPGGPSVSKAANNGNKNRFHYTMPLLRKPGCDGSFSGLKTATKLHIEKLGSSITERDKNDIAASFQDMAIRFMVRQLEKAYNMISPRVGSVVIAGGVAANTMLRSAVQNFADANGIKFYAPPSWLCGDNAVMIGWCALERIKSGFSFSALDFPAKPRWKITDIQ